jgi:hypothetical protein
VSENTLCVQYSQKTRREFLAAGHLQTRLSQDHFTVLEIPTVESRKSRFIIPIENSDVTLTSQVVLKSLLPNNFLQVCHELNLLDQSNRIIDGPAIKPKKRGI